MPPSDYFRDCTARIVRDPIVMAGSSDGGAHLLSFTGPTTRRVSSRSSCPTSSRSRKPSGSSRRFPRRSTASAIAASFARAPGPIYSSWISALRAGSTRLVHDFPAKSGRFVVDAEGYAAVVVNGEVLLENGHWTGPFRVTSCAEREGARRGTPGR